MRWQKVRAAVCILLWLLAAYMIGFLDGRERGRHDVFEAIRAAYTRGHA